MLKPKSIISGPELLVSRPKWIVCEAKLNVSKAKAVIYGPHLINCVTNIIISAPLCSNVPPRIGASLLSPSRRGPPCFVHTFIDGPYHSVNESYSAPCCPRERDRPYLLRS